MKKLLCLIGSPRKRGNTSIMVERLMIQLDKSSFRSEKCFLYDVDIKPCLDCRACKKGDLTCVVKDGMAGLYPKLEEADIIVIGSPIYWFGPTAQTKLLLDRFRPYYGSRKLAGKKALLLLPAGTGAGDCDLTIDMFKRSFEALDVEYLTAVTAEAYDAGDVLKDSHAIDNITILAKQINRSAIHIKS